MADANGMPEDIRSTEEIEAENEAKIERLTALGVPEGILNAIAIQVRVEAIVAAFPQSLRNHIERTYETALGNELDDFYTHITTKRIITPSTGPN